MSPSDVWALDLLELRQLLDLNGLPDIDTSIMLKHQRIKNGADPKWLTEVS